MSMSLRTLLSTTAICLSASTASAASNQFRGVNGADPRDNFEPGASTAGRDAGADTGGPASTRDSGGDAGSTADAIPGGDDLVCYGLAPCCGCRIEVVSRGNERGAGLILGFVALYVGRRRPRGARRDPDARASWGAP